jgi:hypothetical protein
MPMKGTSMAADLCEEFMKVLQSLDIWKQKLAILVM